MSVEDSEKLPEGSTKINIVQQTMAVPIDSKKLRELFGPSPQGPDDSEESPLANRKDIFFDEGPTPDY